MASTSTETKPEPGTTTLGRVRRQIHVLPFLPAGSTFVFALALLAALHGAGLLLFTRGFLLTRQAISNINDCDPIAKSGNLDASCSLPPTHSKLVFLVVDALRADFLFPVDKIPSPAYANHITFPAALAAENPTHSFLSHFIADAPTTTLQRLKGLTTGSLPTFIDMGSNFAGERADEDNWLWQAKRAGKRIALVGDETWLNVFPRGEKDSVWDEKRIWTYDSFDVEDLDSVDRGVRKHLLQLLEEQGEWDIVVAHGLGVDHAGHRFGADHPEMTRKLKETEQLLSDVVDKLDEETLLVVIGDHGMTDRGDHGGDTREEVDAALWIYSKAKEPLIDPTWFERPLSSTAHPLASLYNTSTRAHELGDRFELEWPDKAIPMARSVSQVDLVPTLSLLLGLPVPFGNLGLPIPELFFHSSSLPVAPTPPSDTDEPKGFFGIVPPSHPEARDHESLSPLQTLLHATLLTSSQLSNYLLTYTSLPTGKDLLPAMPELSFILSMAKSAYTGAHAPGHDMRQMELRALEKFWTFERKAREKARIVWARFDPVLMGAGLTIWAGSILVALRLASATKRGPTARFVLGRGVEGALLGLVGSTALAAMGAFRRFGGLRPLGFIFATALGTEIGALIGPTPGTVAQAFGLQRFLSLRQFAPLLPLLAHAALFASNSLTVFEDSAVLWLLTTLLVCTLVRAFAAPEARLRNRLIGFSLAALGCTRLMAWSTICREEQVPGCRPMFYLTAGSTSANAVLALAGLAALVVPTLLRSSLAISVSDEGLAPLFLGASVRALLVGGAAYWAVDSLISASSLSASNAAFAVLVKTGIARVVLVGAILTATLIWRYSPLCIRVQRDTVKNDRGEAVRTQIRVIGFANALGSSYLLFFAAVFALAFLVSSPPAQLVLSLHLVVLLCLLEIFDSERDVQHLTSALTTSTSIEHFLSGDLPPAPPHTGPTFVQISTLALLSHLSFFSTGHQAVLSSIQWSTAFIGFPSLTYPFAPALVALNTLSSHVLGALAVPLFVLWNLSPTLKDQTPLTVGRHLLRAGAYYATYEAVLGLSSAACAAWLRRHLMVWKVFAPRFMLGAVSILAVDATLVVLAMGWGAWGVLAKAKSSLGTRVME
ncbi:SPOSA6832_00163, partial [Sporobolomyces salmonicolor]